MGSETPYCMVDNRGRRVDAPLPHMQSEENLKRMIREDNQRAGAWAELKARQERVNRCRELGILRRI